MITSKDMEEIKISDLSVGDWVRYRDREWQVCSLYKFTEEVGLWRKDSQFCEYVSDLHPIPLTPEILEKNGLCVVEEDADFSEYELFGSENFSIFHTKGTLHYRLETPQASVVCWNVHQLQHALRLAGVEKEIEV